MAANIGFTYQATEERPALGPALRNTVSRPTNPTVYHPAVNEDIGVHPSEVGNEDVGQLERMRSQDIGDLARHFTHQSRLSTGGPAGSSGAENPNPFEFEPGSDLDPSSDKFDARKYTRALGGMIRGAGIDRHAGIAYRNMSVHGFGGDADYQSTVSNVPLSLLNSARELVSSRKNKVQILSGVDGVLEAGEMLVVLGPPGSGCTTLLKTIAGEMNGIYLDDKADINYRGITPEQMNSKFRGEAIYTAEVDVHFPNLTVGQTLEYVFAALSTRHRLTTASPPRPARHASCLRA